MKKSTYSFSRSSVSYYFGGDFSQVSKIVGDASHVFITDENVFNSNKKKFKGSQVIVIRAGEDHKNQATVDSIINQLIELKADRSTWLVGVGGGVVTDITGYVASIYMRGIRFGFIPTTILGMVDAAVGGKNGIDVGVYKNIVGTISQPAFLLYDVSLLKSLPIQQWTNGFAEVIKHACIKDQPMFRLLQRMKLGAFKKDPVLLSNLIKRNALLKTKVVLSDEFEQGERRLLNFGHTIGHAIENQYGLLHGHAISVGMVAACRLSEMKRNFRSTEEVIALLDQYGLPTSIAYEKQKVFETLRMDKKRAGKEMKFVLLEKIGRSAVVPIQMDELEKLINLL